MSLTLSVDEVQRHILRAQFAVSQQCDTKGYDPHVEV
jgi:hypothetical protein